MKFIWWNSSGNSSGNSWTLMNLWGCVPFQLQRMPQRQSRFRQLLCKSTVTYCRNENPERDVPLLAYFCDQLENWNAVNMEKNMFKWLPTKGNAPQKTQPSHGFLVSPHPLAQLLLLLDPSAARMSRVSWFGLILQMYHGMVLRCDVPCELYKCLRSVLGLQLICFSNLQAKLDVVLCGQERFQGVPKDVPVQPCTGVCRHYVFWSMPGTCHISPWHWVR